MALTTHFAQALGEYERSGKTYRKVGGFKWCWKRIISREAFAKDGIWIGSSKSLSPMSHPTAIRVNLTLLGNF